MFAAASKSGRASAAAPTPTDPSFAYVPLLLNTGTTNGQQNNTFLDSSTNNFTITRNGTPTQGSITPYWPNGQWSNYFNGTNSYLTFGNNAAFNFGTGDFTVETWIYVTGTGSGANATASIVGGNQSAAAYWNLYFNTSTNVISWFGNDSVLRSTSNTVTSNTWTHVAVSRSSSVLKIFINGVEGYSATVTASYSLPTNGARIAFDGPDGVSTGNKYFLGYISNLRVVKGTGVYTTGFTPPTSPLTAITNTSLLTCQSNRFKDNSTNNFTIASFGTPTVQAFQPFSPTASYTTALYGGSGYFNGSTDYLSAPASTSWQFTADYTIEAWIYVLSLASFGTIYGTGGAGADDQFTYTTTGQLFWANQGTSAGIITTNQWLHVAAARSGTTLKIFVNGVAQLTATQTGTIGQNLTAYVGRRSDGVNFVNGYISNFRIVKGTAVYTANFTPPTTPVTNITNTSLLLNMANAGIYDAAAQNNAITVGNAQVSTAQSKWSPSSMAFDGTTDALSIPSSTSFGLGTGNWTIEFWVYLNATTTQTLVSMLTVNASVAPHIYYANASGIRYFTNNADRITGGALTTGVWNYIALTKASGTTRMYINGTQTGSNYTDANNYGTTNPFAVGDYGVPLTGASTLNGYVQDVRITKGVARTITTPTAAFPTR